MTTATSATTAALPRRRVRIAAAAAGLAAALVLTACGGDGSDGDNGGDGGDSTDKASSAAPSATETSDTGGGSGSSGAQSELAGSWVATTQGKAVALIVTGVDASVFDTGGSVCSGSAKEESGMQMIRLTCPDGGDDRTVGMVDSVSAESLTVTWESGVGKETYQKAPGGKLPSELSSGLPTAGLGS
ncbi:hypothetical protein E0500_011695 [Streptomyces sp. KM273126]|uniref:hypothetical protein n=1 Tax=Streptomyces sp. KM273126 TaxID=2545247 RepID=UPI00103BED74|nr:hypothetical protein [Streptomyces sp. KM273126]MBA2808054.1 hypothetical protein [Streptomyces sp. KM273126]